MWNTQKQTILVTDQPAPTWVERAAVVTAGAGWVQSDDGADDAWTAGAYKEILFFITGDNAYFFLGTSDPTNTVLLPVNCPMQLTIPLDATDVFIKRAAGTNVTLNYVLLPY